MHGSAMTSFIRSVVLLALFIAAVGIYLVSVIHLRHVNLSLSGAPRNRRLPKSRRIVVLVSQPRSGSTFLGRFINMFKEMPYVYEPLHAVLKLNQVTNRSKEAMAMYANLATSFLKEFFDCKFSAANEEWMNKVFNSPMSFQSSFSQLCAKTTAENMRLCSEPKTVIFRSLCRRQKALFVKLLEPRLPVPLDQLSQLSPETADMYIVYLTRDPRASFWSLLNMGWVHDKNDGYFDTYLSERCQEILLNIKRIATGTRNIMILRYEDLLKNPLIMARSMSKLLGEKLTAGIYESYTQLIFKNEKNCFENGSFVTPTVTRPNWRNEADESFVRSIERHCGGVMDVLGYKRVKETMYRNCHNDYLEDFENVPILEKLSNANIL